MTLPTFSTTSSAGGLVSTTYRMISEMANMPIIIGIMPMPPIISVLPKVKRGWPAGLPRPTHATSKPSSSVTSPFSGRSDVMNTAHVRPSSTSQKYSNELKLSAKSASAGAATISTDRAEQAADGREHQARAERDLGLALRVMAKASSVYAADAGVPGMRNRQPGMSPEKIAIAVAVTIAAIAGIGGMKNVTGTSSAVAMVAVRPGHRADEQAKERRQHHHHDGVRLEHHRECLREVFPHRSSTRRRESTRPRAAARAAACRTRSG